MIPKIETLSSLDIKLFQEEKLRELLIYLNENSPYYKEKFIKEAVDINTLLKLDDLSKISVTTKTDIQLNNDRFFCSNARNY